MRLSDWQLNRLRDALGAYHDYERGIEGDYFNWKDVSAAIEESTGVSIPQERLRQFVEGVKTPDGGRKFPVPQDAWIDAIVKFATDEDSALMTEAELREHAPSLHAALRLLEYLDQAFDTARVLPPATLEGTYRSAWFEPSEGAHEDFVVREITLQRASEAGLIQLAMMEDSYDLLAGPQFEDWTPKQRTEARHSRIIYGGWGILTPEDNLLLFLKNERNGRNCYFLTVASDLSHASQSPVKGLALLRHDYPMESEDDEPLEPKKMPAIIERVGNGITLFQRIT